jgi:hypothetical protein
MLHFYSKNWRKSISNRASLQSGRPPRARPRRHAPGRLGRPPASPSEPPTRLLRPLAPSQRSSLLTHAARVPRPSNAAPPYVLPARCRTDAARSSSPCPRRPPLSLRPAATSSGCGPFASRVVLPSTLPFLYHSSPTRPPGQPSPSLAGNSSRSGHHLWPPASRSPEQLHPCPTPQTGP